MVLVYQMVANDADTKASLVNLSKSNVPGHQVLIEGLIADILNEHFGESVELVGIALFRNGPMTFPELVRICNMNFLSFPRENLNFFNEYSNATFSMDSVSFRSLRDALLVMIHHELVSATHSVPCTYSLNSMEVFNRLLFPIFLEQFQGPERDVIEELLKKSKVPRAVLTEAISGEAVESLQARRAIVSVDSMTISSPTKSSTSPRKEDRLVMRFNSTELQLGVLKHRIAEYVDSKYGSNLCQIVNELMETVTARPDTADSAKTSSIDFKSKVSIGDLSVSDISKRLRLSNNDLISALIKLQQSGIVSKKQSSSLVAAEPVKASGGRKRKSPSAAPTRAKNLRQMQAMMESEPDEGKIDDFSDMIGENSHSFSGIPSYSIRFFEILEEIEAEITFEIIKAKYGSDGSRVFELLSRSGQKYEASHIADVCAISREDALKYVHSFARDGLGHIQEVPKVTTSSATAAGGVSAMMRAVASSFWLYSTEDDRVRRALVSMISNSIVNLRRRFRFEVNRQCRIEDRASLLTKAEQQYLETVHAAQDILEASSIQLVSSLLILLIRA
jgi:hypothetical protein